MNPADTAAGAQFALSADQRPAPTPPGLRVHRDPGGRQRLEVAARGRDGDLQLAGDFRRGHLASGLHQEDDGDQSVSPHPEPRSRR